MSIDLTERSYERPPAAGRPRSVPYLRLVHSSDKPRIENANEHEDEGRNGSFALVIAAAAVAVLGVLALLLA